MQYSDLVPQGQDLEVFVSVTHREQTEHGEDVCQAKVGLGAAGFSQVEITPTHQVADGMHSAIIRATKPTAGQPGTATHAQADPCCG